MISASPALGPEPRRRRSFAIFVSETATVFSAPEASTSPSRAACASNGSAGGAMVRPVSSERSRADALGELRVGVQAGADGGPAERDLPDAFERVPHAGGALTHLRRVARELLAERHRHRVHQVRPAGLDDVVELRRLALERVRELLERRQEVVRQLLERREVDGGREDVVGGLAHVDVVVRVDVLARERGEHLVRVHVRGGAGAGLEDVDRKLVVELAGRDALGCGGDALGLVRVEEAELRVHPCRGTLDPAEPACDGCGDRLAGDREVGDRLAGLAAPELRVRLDVGHDAKRIEQGLGGLLRRRGGCGVRAGARGSRAPVSRWSTSAGPFRRGWRRWRCWRRSPPRPSRP